MGCNHAVSAWSEVERVAREYVDRGLLDDDVEAEVATLLEADEPKEALDVAIEHYRARRRP